jgi:hypothetical protein
VIIDSSIRSVVHLVAPPTQQDGSNHGGRIVPTVLCANALKNRLVPQGRVILVGDQSVNRSASSLGLDCDSRISPVFHNPRFMARNLQSFVTPDTHVMCWSDELFSSALAVCPSTELISTAPNLVGRSPRGQSMIRTLDELDRDTWSSRNRSPILDRDLTGLVDELAYLPERSEQRDQLGIDEKTICIGALSDCPSRTDARQFTFLLGLFASVGYKIAAVIPKTADRMSAARRHQRGLRGSFRLILAEDPIVGFLPALDVLLHSTHDGTGSANLIERLCENNGTPVIRVSHPKAHGLTHTPGAAQALVEQLDEIVNSQLDGASIP